MAEPISEVFNFKTTKRYVRNVRYRDCDGKWVEALQQSDDMNHWPEVGSKDDIVLSVEREDD